jgi:hypothetical protein
VECPYCQYDLYGIPLDRCPECGAVVDLRTVLLHHESARERLELQAERRLCRTALAILVAILLVIGLGGWLAGLLA